MSAHDRERVEPLWRGPFDYEAARARYREQIAEANARRDRLCIKRIDRRPVSIPYRLIEDLKC